jgi:hypothetical protein
LAETVVLIAALVGWAVLYIVPHPLAILPALFVAIIALVYFAATI